MSVVDWGGQRLPWRVFANALAGGGCSDAVASFWAVD